MNYWCSGAHLTTSSFSLKKILFCRNFFHPNQNPAETTQKQASAWSRWCLSPKSHHRNGESARRKLWNNICLCHRLHKGDLWQQQGQSVQVWNSQRAPQHYGCKEPAGQVSKQWTLPQAPCKSYAGLGDEVVWLSTRHNLAASFRHEIKFKEEVCCSHFFSSMCCSVLHISIISHPLTTDKSQCYTVLSLFTYTNKIVIILLEIMVQSDRHVDLLRAAFRKNQRIGGQSWKFEIAQISTIGSQ